MKVLVLGVLAGAACGVTDSNKLPPDVQDPTTLQTPAGALARYREVAAEFGAAFDGMMITGGILTDEMAALPLSLGISGYYTGLDSRRELAGIGGGQFERLSRLRAQAREGRGFLGTYAPDSSPALSAHLYVMEGYAEIFLADLFCSGIPLSTVDFDGNYTLAAGSTTSEVYGHAVALFDSALTLAGDSVSFQHLAAVGRGRALLALGRYSEAATAVAAVPDEYRYQTLFEYRLPPSGNVTSSFVVPDSATLWLFGEFVGNSLLLGVPSMANQEGSSGLDYHLAGDPRVVATAITKSGKTMFFPAKYPLPAANQVRSVMFTVADGVEARLIEAEAALQVGDPGWLTKLNALRTDGTFTTQPNAQDATKTDTLWNAGSGGVPKLRPLEDPEVTDPALRVNLLFRERAFWLYLTGHRQGDLRRLIRQHVRGSDTVYPTGSYPGAEGSYGGEVVVPVPESERQLNPKYAGCFHRDA